AYADTKSAMGKKQENVIQKPADDASDDVKAAYKAEIAKAGGAPDSAADYEFFKAEKLPDGMERSQELEDKFRAVFHEHKAPKALVTALSQVFEETQIGAFTALMEANSAEAAKVADEKQKRIETSHTELKTLWPGDDLGKNARISLKAINIFGADDLKKNLADAKIYENATDLAAWEKAGVPAATLQLFHKVALKTLDAKQLGDDTPGSDHDMTTAQGRADALYAKTKVNQPAR
ncbi:hypothetical protein LCGC14_3114610, partial [marine sediment metagenome]